jgi:hypothetical protein
MAKQTLIALVLLALGGCAATTPGAGKAHYTLTYTDSKGGVYVIDLLNTKNIGQLDAGVEINGVRVWLKEEGVDAASPMAQMAEANARMIQQVLDSVP